MYGSDFYNNTANIVLGNAYGEMAIEDSCFQENSALGLAYTIGSNLAKESNNFAKDNAAFCAGNYDIDAEKCTLFTAFECRGNTTGGGPACYNESNLALGISVNSSVTGLYTVCAGTVFDDIMLISSSDIIVQCEVRQTCYFKGGEQTSLIISGSEESSETNVTISGMIFTGAFSEEPLIVAYGDPKNIVSFEDCLFTVGKYIVSTYNSFLNHVP